MEKRESEITKRRK